MTAESSLGSPIRRGLGTRETRASTEMAFNSKHNTAGSGDRLPTQLLRRWWREKAGDGKVPPRHDADECASQFRQSIVVEPRLGEDQRSLDRQ